MKIAATPIALAAFCLGMVIVPAGAADRESHAPTTQVALQPAPAAGDAETATANCLLPGQIHTFDGVTMVTPRRAVGLAGADCAARGGRPIADAAAE